MISCDQNKTESPADVLAQHRQDPQPDDKICKGGWIRSVRERTSTHVYYYRSRAERPWLQHPKRCTLAGWECWASDAEIWEDR